MPTSALTLGQEDSDGELLLFPLSVFSLAVPGSLFAGEVNRSWEELMQKLAPGKSVTVTRMNSAQVEGKLTPRSPSGEGMRAFSSSGRGGAC